MYYIPIRGVIEIENEKEWNLRPDGKSVAPSMSVKDRTVVGHADHVQIVLTTCRE